jgi:hypothetical protein
MCETKPSGTGPLYFTPSIEPLWVIPQPHKIYYRTGWSVPGAPNFFLFLFYYTACQGDTYVKILKIGWRSASPPATPHNTSRWGTDSIGTGCSTGRYTAPFGIWGFAVRYWTACTAEHGTAPQTTVHLSGFFFWPWRILEGDDYIKNASAANS